METLSLMGVGVGLSCGIHFKEVFNHYHWLFKNTQDNNMQYARQKNRGVFEPGFGRAANGAGAALKIPARLMFFRVAILHISSMGHGEVNNAQKDRVK